MYFTLLFHRYQALLLEFRDHEIHSQDIQDYRPEMLQKLLKIVKPGIIYEP